MNRAANTPSRPSRGRSFIRYSIAFVALSGIAWLGGLLWFIATMNTPPPAIASPVDAIVVLTGGSQRVTEGFRLLTQGKGKRLFVSGVYRGTDTAEISRIAHQAPTWAACCLALGHEAHNTEGNALETARWLYAQNYRSILLVTANYHMKRSLVEFRRVLPANIIIVPDPVFPEGKQGGWWGWHYVLVEYMKYLLACGRALMFPLPDSPYRGTAPLLPAAHP